MNGNCRKLEGFMPAYLAGKLDTFDTIELEVHLESCDACRDSLINLAEIYDQVQQGLAPAGPEMELAEARRARLRRAAEFESLQHESATVVPFPVQKEAPPRRRVRYATAAALAAAAMLLAAGILFLNPAAEIPEPGAKAANTGETAVPEVEPAADPGTPRRVAADSPSTYATAPAGQPYIYNGTYGLDNGTIVFSTEPYFGLAGPPPTFFSLYN